MGPSLQLVRAQLLSFLLSSKVSRDFKLRAMSILQTFRRSYVPIA